MKDRNGADSRPSRGGQTAGAFDSEYNEKMARGWESKSVEAQQAEATQGPAKSGPPMTAEQAAAVREKETLRLSRQRVLEQLEATQNPRHREVLQHALAALDEKLRRS